MKILGLLLFAALIALLVVTIFPVAAVVLTRADFGSGQVLYGSVSLFLSFCTFLAIVLATLLLIGAIRAVVRRLPGPGGTPPTRPEPSAALLSFTVVALFSVSTLSGLLSGFAGLFQQLFLDLAKMMDDANLRALLADLGGDRDNSEVMFVAYLRVLGQVEAVYGRLFSAAVQLFANSSVVGLLCWWLALYLLCLFGSTTAVNHTNFAARIRDWLQSLSPAQRHRLLLGTVFVIGLYFSIAAVIAIPALQKSAANSSITRESVEKTLASISTSKDAFQQRFPEDYKKELPLLTQLPAVLEKIAAEAKRRAALLPEANQASYTAFYDARLQQLRDTLKDVTAMRSQRIGALSKLRNEVFARQQKLASQAVSAFEVGTLNPLSGPERVAYLQDVVGWFQNAQAASENNLQFAMADIDAFDVNLSWLTSDLQNDVFIVVPPDPSSPYLPTAYDPLNRLRTWMSGLGPSYYESPNRSLPSAPEPGAFAGVFGFISRWLLRTRSFSLALITGMIGFGLLGAATTNYVRADISDRQGITAGRVIIQGVSAAIVIFLTVHGGLAMLSVSDNEANGYVMCFACFVGAVFSEHVWQWAKTRLETLLPPHAPPPVSTGGGSVAATKS